MKKLRVLARDGVELIVPASTEDTRIIVGVCSVQGRRAVLGVMTVPAVRIAYVTAEVTKLTDTYVPYVPKNKRDQPPKADGDTSKG